jgi:tight adherence protein B
MAGLLRGDIPILITVLTFLTFLCLLQGTLWWFADPERKHQRQMKKRMEELKGRESLAAPGSLLKADVLEASTFLQSLKKLHLLDQVQLLILQGNVNWTLGRFLLLSLVFGVAGLGLGFLKWGVLGAPLLGWLGSMMPYLYLKSKKKRRLKKFEKQLPDALDLMARGMKAGHSFSSSLQLASDGMPDPLGPEFFQTFQEHSHGMELNTALLNMCQRVDLQDLRFFATAVMIQRETGGNLTEILEKLSALIRERFQLRNQIMALTAEGRLSGWVLVALSPSIALILFYINPEYEMMLIRHPMGHIMTVMGLSAQLLGMLFIRKIVNIRV